MNTFTKNSFQIIAIFLASLVLIQSDLVEIDPYSKIRPGGSKANDGNVYGARSCGGQGQFIKWRLSECKTTDSPCEFPADGETHDKEFTFIPSQDVEQLGIKVVASINGSEPIVVEDHPLENSKVVGGTEQTIYFTGRIPKENKGSTLTGQVIFYRVFDRVVEMCAEADFILV